MDFAYSLQDVNKKITLHVSEQGDVRFEAEGFQRDVAPSEVAHVLIKAPGLFRKGMIAMFGNEGMMGETAADGTVTPLAVVVNGASKKNFFPIYLALRERGFNIHAM